MSKKQLTKKNKAMLKITCPKTLEIARIQNSRFPKMVFLAMRIKKLVFSRGNFREYISGIGAIIAAAIVFILVFTEIDGIPTIFTFFKLIFKIN